MFSHLIRFHPGSCSRRVDLPQLKVLVREAVRTSFRGYESDSAHGERSIRSGFRHMLITYLIMSIGLCALAALCGNQTTYNTLLISYGMMMTAFAILVEYNDLILNAEDAEILFTKPISSQTIFWSRFTTLLLFVLLYSASLLFLPAIASFHFAKSKLYFFPLVFLVMMLACVVSAFGVVYLYVQLLRWVRPQRLTSWLTYFQTVFSLFLFYGYYRFLLHRQAQGRVSIAKAVENIHAVASRGSSSFNLVLDQSSAFHFLPPAWFAGTIDLFLGHTGGQATHLSLAALGLLLIVVALIVKGVPGGYLNLLTTYAFETETGQGRGHAVSRRHQTNPQSAFRQATSQIRSIIGLLPAATQSGYQLVSRYLTRDVRLRRGIYPFFGIVLFYFVYAIDNPNFVINIFQASSSLEVVTTHPAYVLLPLCILIATNATQYCSDWKAAWIFRVAPVDRLRLHIGYRLAGFAHIYGPIWFGAVIFYWFNLNLGALLSQMLILLLIIHFLLALSFQLDPHLPLSQPPRLHAGFLKFTSVMFLLVAVSQGLLVLTYLTARHRFALWEFYLVLVLLTGALELLAFGQVRPLIQSLKVPRPSRRSF